MPCGAEKCPRGHGCELTPDDGIRIPAEGTASSQGSEGAWGTQGAEGSGEVRLVWKGRVARCEKRLEGQNSTTGRPCEGLHLCPFKREVATGSDVPRHQHRVQTDRRGEGRLRAGDTGPGWRAIQVVKLAEPRDGWHEEGRRVERVITQADFTTPAREGPLERGTAFPPVKREQEEQRKGWFLRFSNTGRVLVQSAPG